VLGQAALGQPKSRFLAGTRRVWREMSVEALLLALTAIVRPTSVAAVFAMLSTRRPRRLLLAYLFAGLTFSLAIGILVVALLRGLTETTSSTTTRPVLDIALGVLSIGYAVATLVGWLPRRKTEAAPDSTAWVRRRLQNLSPSGAGLAGVLTHLPGLVYLAALNAIAASTTAIVVGLAQVVIYNAIWFSLPIAALALSVYRPAVSRSALEELSSWARQNRKLLVLLFFGGLGAYLIVNGITHL
jgi:hypothetical protein